MKIFFLILFILIGILFIPITLKLHLSFIDSKLNINFYNFKLYPRKKDKERKASPKIKSKKRKNIFSSKKQNILSYSFIKGFLLDLEHRSYKPTLSLFGYTAFSLGNPKDTALSYGILHSFLPFVYKGISILFKSKKNAYKITPLFQDRLFLESNIKCIIKISLGQFIYIGLIFIKNLYLNRRCSH